jgi:hypothetical protein
MWRMQARLLPSAPARRGKARLGALLLGLGAVAYVARCVERPGAAVLGLHLPWFNGREAIEDYLPTSLKTASGLSEVVAATSGPAGAPVRPGWSVLSPTGICANRRGNTNSCFLAAAMQLIVASPPLLRTLAVHRPGVDPSIPNAIQPFVEQYRQGGIVDPKFLRQSLLRLGVVPSERQQEDADEVLSMLLSYAEADPALRTKMRRYSRFRRERVVSPDGKSRYSGTPQIESFDDLTCDERGVCETVGRRSEEPTLRLYVADQPADGQAQTLDSLIAAAQRETLDDPDARLALDYQGMRMASVQQYERAMDLEQLAPELVITLARAGWEGPGGKKISTPVHMPLHWSPGGKHPTYELVSVVSHHGKTLRSGHYTAMRKWGTQWYLLNDERVDPISDSDAERMAAGEGLMFLYRAEAKKRR